MKQTKIKRYRLSVSRTFPVTHPRKGEDTFFIEKIKRKQCWMFVNECCTNECNISGEGIKIHTIRGNYPRWEKIMAEVQAGRAVIELFYWEGKPYRSQQIVFETLNKDSGCGVQMLDLSVFNKIGLAMIQFKTDDSCGSKQISTRSLIKNDGLNLHDFYHWFKKADLNETMTIIHFTKFRY